MTTNSEANQSATTRNVVAYLTTWAVFLALDAVWLGLFAGPFYIDRLNTFVTVEVDYLIAFGFYSAYVIGIVIFAVAPALDRNDWRHAALFGGLFGVFCYGTYDLTNLATLRDWPIIIAVVDIPWGGVVTGLSAVAGFALTRRLLGRRAANT